MMNQKALGDYSSLTLDALATKAKEVSVGMTGKDEFPNPSPTMPVFNELVADYQQSLVNAKTGNKLDIARRNALRKQVLAALKSLALYVNMVANGNVEIILLSGLSLSKLPQPSVLAVPENLQLSQGKQPGSILSKFPRPKGAISFKHMWTPHPLTPKSVWESVSNSLITHEFENLEQGVMYWFKVVAVGSRNQTTESEPVSQFVMQWNMGEAA